MAHMHPEDIQNYNHTKSEEFFYEKLRDKLSQKYHCFFSIRWFDKVDGKRVDSECDFLIFDPGFGFLTVEVKGGIRIDINAHMKWELTEYDEDRNLSRRELSNSPFIQAEKSMRYFYNAFSDEYLQSFRGTYGFAVCFPFYQVDEKIEAAAEEDLIIDVRHMNRLEHRINEIFHYWKSRNNAIAPFSSDQKQKFISMIHKRISLSAAAGALIPLKEKEFQKINLVQDNIIDFLSNYKQVQIVGGAGTGKTFMAMKKLCRENYNERKILYLCKNRELARFVHECIGDSAIKCTDFISLMKEILKKEMEDNTLFFDAIMETDVEPFDVIVVDEAQDFSVDEALAVRHLLRDDYQSVLYVFLDENQNLFNVDFNSSFAIDSPPYILRYNIRNTGEIYKYATTTTGLGAETKANTLLGVMPEVRETKNRVQTLSTVAAIVNRLVQKEYVNTNSIVILSDLEYNKSIFGQESQVGAYNINFGKTQKKKNEILFRSVSEFKGLEADVIIYITNSQSRNINEQTKRQEDYVAFTRARYYLYIIKQRQL